MKCAWLCCWRQNSGYRRACAAGLGLKQHALNAQTMNLAIRQIPVNRLSGAQAQQSATDRGQYRNPTSRASSKVVVCKVMKGQTSNEAQVHHGGRAEGNWMYLIKHAERGLA